MSHMLFVAVVKKSKKSKKTFKIHSAPTPKDVSPFKVKQGSVTKATHGGKSSPLGSRNVDYNSPRAIVQRKQADKLALRAAGSLPRKCSLQAKYQRMADDKENCNQY